MKYIISLLATLWLSTFAQAATNSNKFWSPSDIKALTLRVIDNFVDNADFSMQYVLQAPARDVAVVDFGASCPNLDGVAYALTSVDCEADQRHNFQVGGTGEIKIWIDDKLVFERAKEPFTHLLDEKSYYLNDNFTVELTKGKHKLLVKSSNDGGERWIFAIQGVNMSRQAQKGEKIFLSIKDYLPALAVPAQWLIAGTFKGGIETVFEPERAIELFEVYRSEGRSIAWNIPRINIVADNADKKMAWSYHLGGFMWGLQRLSDETGDGKYEKFAARWGEQMLDREAMVKHQVFDLHAFMSMNYGQAGRPMLDFISAPNISYITRLERGDAFPESARYQKKADEVIDYLQNIQYRNSGVFARTYTKYPSIWVDDMFMGLPFMLHYANATKRKSQRDSLINDAVAQLFRFAELLRDPATGLYRQACYPSHREELVPFWGRGNGWALWATSEVLGALTYKDKDYNRVRNLYRSHVDALLKYQDSEGYWHNILDMPATNRESSCTTIFTMCMARGINRGWISRTKYAPMMVKGWSATASFVNDKNEFTGVTPGTNFSTNPEDYNKPTAPNDTHGLLPFTFAAIEMMKFAYGCQNCY